MKIINNKIKKIDVHCTKSTHYHTSV